MRQAKSVSQSPITPEQIDDLTQAVISLTEQVRMLRHAVDEIESELGWAIRTKVLDRLPPPDFACDARLSLNSPPNEFGGFEHACDPEDLRVNESPQPPDNSPVTPPSVPRRQSSLW